MKFTPADKVQLTEWGYSESDIKQIEEAASRNHTIYTMGGQRISREEAINLLGRKEFLSGISRSAFHFTASRETENGKFIRFDSSKWLLETT